MCMRCSSARVWRDVKRLANLQKMFVTVATDRIEHGKALLRGLQHISNIISIYTCYITTIIAKDVIEQ